MEQLVLFTLGIAAPLTGIALLGMFFLGLWYFFSYLPAPVPADELAGLSGEVRELLATLDSERPIARGDLNMARQTLHQAALLDAQLQAVRNADVVK